MDSRILTISIILMMSLMIAGCTEDKDEGNGEENEKIGYPTDTRYSKIPQEAVKMGPGGDPHPPVLHSDLFSEPVPLPGPVNTAGAEDSPFILPDGNTLYFFFTPDVTVPPEKQLLDNVTGIWVSKRTAGGWTEPERVWLQEPGKLALDGAPFVEGDEMWFASAREGYTGVHMFTAEMVNGSWTNWEYAGDLLNVQYEMGEMHRVGDTIYFHSGRAGGKGGYDIWTTTLANGSWAEPVNVEEVNSVESDSLPWVNEDETEMFFTRTYLGTPGIFRSVKVNGTWSEPEMILSSFAGEPTLDDEGNLYFVHHYYRDGEMVEADIYYCERI